MRFSLAAATAVLFAAGLPAAAQSKVAIIDINKAVVNTAEIKKAQAELEAKFKPRQEAMQKLEKELQGIQNQLQTMQGKLTAQAEQDLQVTGQRKQRELQRMGEDLQADVERERQEILQRTIQRMNEVVKKLSEEKAYDVVIDVTNTVYFKNALEITADATAAYDKAYPAK
jgi:outer membrane protein